MKMFFDAFEEEWNNPELDYYYILSTQWLKRWKRYTSYDNVTKGQEIDVQWFGQVEPGRINEDIVREHPCFLKYSEVDDHRNVFLKEGVQDQKDYILITRGAWEHISEKYPGIGIERKAFTNPNGMKSIEVILKQVIF